MKFDRIVAYGCSYTAGQELGDAIILGKTHEEVDEYKRNNGIHCIKGVYGDEKTRAKCTELSSKLSWPNYIAEKLNIPCLNRAELGTSVNEFIFNIERDIAKNVLRDTDLILVGLTTPTRFSWITDSGKMVTRFICDDRRWTYNIELNNALLDTWATDCNLVWEYFKHMKYLDMLSKLLGGRLKMLTPVDSLVKIKSELSGYKNVDWLDLDRDIEHVLLPHLDMHKLEPKNLRHGWGHPTVEIHKIYADAVLSVLIKQGIVDV